MPRAYTHELNTRREVLVRLLCGMHAGDLRQCDPKASCVSSSAIRSPSQYMPAWDFAPTELDQAFAAVVSNVRELEGDGDAQLLKADPDHGYVKARLRFDLKGIII